MTIQGSISINPNKIIGDVHDYLYGTNLEHLGEAIYGGIWAEMLKSPKFAGVDPRWKMQAQGGALNPDHGIVLPWEGVNRDYERVIFDHDHQEYYTRTPEEQGFGVVRRPGYDAQTAFIVDSTPQSQRIIIREADGQQHGIKQGKLLLHAGRSYDLRIVLKGNGQDVLIQLGDQSWTISAGSDWETHRTSLTPGQSSTDGELSITVSSVGSLRLARVSLMPSDNLSGFRRDVVEAIKNSWVPTFLRWPGGNFASAYHWQDGIGDVDRRPPYLDPAWQLFEYNDVGTDEFMVLCKLLGTEPVLTINIGNGTPEEGQAWVEYCNGGTDTEYGALRAANGHPEPYNVKTWFIGNENYGNWQVGHTNAETYAQRYLEYSRAAREADPDLILLAVGVPTDQYRHWNARILPDIAAETDLLSIHYYSIRTEKWDNPPTAEELVVPVLAAGYEVETLLQGTLDVIAEYSNPPVPLAFDEWNPYLRAVTPDFIEEYNIADALYTGVVMNACLRRCDRIKLSASYHFINVMGNYRVTPGSTWLTPSTLVLELMTNHRGPVGIDCRVLETPTFSSKAIGQQFAYDGVPTLDAAATFDPDKNMVYLSVVNSDLENPAAINLEGLSRNGPAQVFRVSGESGVELNTEAEPEAVTIKESSWADGTHVLEVPPLSFSMVLIPLG
jgi:alpha-N-arabinofuranosidase